MRGKKSLDYSVVTNTLIVGKTPFGGDYNLLKEMGVGLAINMRVEWPTLVFARQKIIPEIWVPTIDSKYYPLNKAKLYNAALVANKATDNGYKIYVYCREGRHRSIVMAATILKMQGYGYDESKRLIINSRPIADPRAIKIGHDVPIGNITKTGVIN